MRRAELGAWLRLDATPGIGAGTARKLLARFGLPHQVFSQPLAALLECVTPAQAHALHTEPEGLAERIDTTWQWLQSAPEGLAHTLVTLADRAYPASLLETADPPPLLYAMGPRAWLQSTEQAWPLPACLAVVGSRNPTAQGAELARQFAQALAQAGLCIVSGLALGVDAAAHEGALDAGASAGPTQPLTVAVVGTGLDRVYPSRHRALAHRIARQGLLISEFPLGTPPLAHHFPKRNRIISGLSQGTLVVEAALASGSLITARLAAEQGREVFAIPGSIHAPQSRGCHALIRQGAKLVETAQDVLEELQPSPRSAASAPSHATDTPPPADERDPVLAALGYDPVPLDTLVSRTGMSAAALQVSLLEWELAGQVARLPGGLFQRIGRA